jgi:hypothetical protein
MINMNRPTAVAIGAILLCVGAISPWITFAGIINAGPTDFTEVAIVFFGALGLLILSLLTGRYMRPITVIVGGLVLLDVAYVWFHLSEQDTNPLVSPGWGLFFTVASALYLIASTWLARPPVRFPSLLGVPDDEVDTLNPYGRCDTCGWPCDSDGCMNNRKHEIALSGVEA